MLDLQPHTLFSSILKSYKLKEMSSFHAKRKIFVAVAYNKVIVIRNEVD